MEGMTIQEAIAKGIVQPGRASVHINKPLTNISIAYMQNEMDFVADRVFPPLPVAKQSDAYFTYDRGEFNRDEMQERADGAESAGATYETGNKSYMCKVWALHKDIGWQTRANYDAPLDPDREATEFLTHKGMIRREREWANQFFKTGVWTFKLDGDADRSGTLSANTSVDANDNVKFWNDSDSDPIQDVEFMADAIQESTGFRPNKLTLGKRVYSALKHHPDIIARLDRGQTPGGPAMSTRQAMARIFEVDEVLVAAAIHNSAAAGLDASHEFIFGKHALLSYSPMSPGLMTPSAGYMFEWTGLTGMAGRGLAIERWYSRDRKADRVEINMAFVPHQIGADLGGFFNGIVQ